MTDEASDVGKLDGASLYDAFVDAVDRCIDDMRVEELCREFEVARSTVARWSSGVAVPLPKIQELIVKFANGDEDWR